MIQFISIMLFSVFCAVAYGLILDQITIRISLEYFTVGHPPLFIETSPSILAIKWGITASWWMGALLGLVLASFARAGSTSRVSLKELIVPIVHLMAMMFLCATVMGAIGYLLGYFDLLEVPAKFAFRIPTQHHDAFLCAEFMHDTSYLVALVGGYGLIDGVRKFRLGKRQTITSTVFLPGGK